MSQEAKLVEVNQEPQKQAEQQIPLLVQYHNQLANFQKQREEVRNQFHQIEGAIFACQLMINQYEESAKKAAEGLLQKNMGELKDGKANDETAKQVAQK